VVDDHDAPSSGTAPPARPVPEPRATNGTPWWFTAARTHAWTSSVLVDEADDGGALHVRGVLAVQRQLGGTGPHP
jgi:hypothetical protein